MSGTMSGFCKRFAAYRQRRRSERQRAMATALSLIFSPETLALALGSLWVRRQPGPSEPWVVDIIVHSAIEPPEFLETPSQDRTVH